MIWAKKLEVTRRAHQQCFLLSDVVGCSFVEGPLCVKVSSEPPLLSSWWPSQSSSTFTKKTRELPNNCPYFFFYFSWSTYYGYYQVFFLWLRRTLLRPEMRLLKCWRGFFDYCLQKGTTPWPLSDHGLLHKISTFFFWKMWGFPINGVA